MNMKHLLLQLKQHRLVPVIAIDSADDALPLAEALAAGGLPLAEITFRTAAAEESIRAIAKAGKMLVGAGTVLNIDTAKRTIDAGASFLVTPGFSHRIVEFCLSREMPVIPGTGSATDLQAAGELGLSLVKFFPAETLGGSSCSRPFPPHSPASSTCPPAGSPPTTCDLISNFPRSWPVAEVGWWGGKPSSQKSSMRFDR